MKRFIALLLAAVMVAALASCNKKNGAGDDTTAEQDGASYNSSDIAVQSDNFSITMGELSYVFYLNYLDFVTNNMDNLNVYGLDTSQSIKNQTYYGTTTWFQYFADASVEYVKDILVLCEGATAAGVALDDDDHAEIESKIQSITTYASDNGYEITDYLTRFYSANVSLDTIRSFTEKQLLGNKYYLQLAEQYQFADDEINQYVNSNPDKFNCIGYLSFSFDENTDSNALDAAESLSQINDAEEFLTFVNDYMKNTLHYSDEQIGSATVNTRYALKDENSEFSTWAFGDEAVVNQTHTEFNDVDGKYTVYLLTRRPALQDYLARNIRYIFVSIETYTTYTAALAKANEILSTWQSGEASDHSFGELAFNYSEDVSTSGMGGLSMNVSRCKGATAFPDALVEWLYADTTAIGSAQVIKGDNGYFIAYYSSDGETEWQYEAKSALAAEKYEQDHASLVSTYPVTTVDAVVSSIDA